LASEIVNSEFNKKECSENILKRVIHKLFLKWVKQYFSKVIGRRKKFVETEEETPYSNSVWAGMQELSPSFACLR